MELVPIGTGRYLSRVTPLKGNSDRVDVEVDEVDEVAAFDSDILDRLRGFFAQIDAEANRHIGDPVALTHALARMEALLADVRYVRDTIRDLDAHALHLAKIRRLTISGVATVEGTNAVERSEWQHRKLLLVMLRKELGAERVIVADTGQVMTIDTLADMLLAWFTPSWRLTPIRDAGLNPDRYCTVAVDDEGKPVREPAVKMADNLIRRMK